MSADKERRPGWTTEATTESSDEKLCSKGSSMERARVVVVCDCQPDQGCVHILDGQIIGAGQEWLGLRVLGYSSDPVSGHPNDGAYNVKYRKEIRVPWRQIANLIVAPGVALTRNEVKP
ncbi:hypothetical protein [Nocardioides sp.]|uniref:hypothetical protein n=1 Tax=Nocardioides sp. TaxID=35761 RepID=UPI00356A47BB